MGKTLDLTPKSRKNEGSVSKILADTSRKNPGFGFRNNGR